MEYLGPIAAGILCGALGGAPYFTAFVVFRRKREKLVTHGLIAVCLSFVVVALSILLGYVFLRSALVPFAIALVIAFLAFVAVSVFIGSRPRP